MLRNIKAIAPRIANTLRKSSFSTTPTNNTKVAVVGACGGIGQPLSLLLKHSPYISNLALYDIKGTEGVAMDLDHIDTGSNVMGFQQDKLAECLDGAEIVVIPAGMPRKPGMDRSDLFAVNAGIVMNVVDQIVKSSFNPFIAIITNPVNSVVPVAAEVLRLNGVFDIRKLFGVTTLDVVRANTFYARYAGFDPREVNVPVVAGHSGNTIVPLFSLAKPVVGGGEVPCDSAGVPKLTVPKSLVSLVRDAGTHVVEAKGGQGSATLSMAYSGFRFVTSLLQARLGKRDVVECTYVYSKYHEDIDFFADPVLIDHEGVAGIMEYGYVSNDEKAMISEAKVQLRKDIQVGYDFVAKNYKAPTDVAPKVLGRATTIPVKKMWLVRDNQYYKYQEEAKTYAKMGDTQAEDVLLKVEKDKGEAKGKKELEKSKEKANNN